MIKSNEKLPDTVTATGSILHTGGKYAIPILTVVGLIEWLIERLGGVKEALDWLYCRIETEKAARYHRQQPFPGHPKKACRVPTLLP